ncbi:response regulator [Vagococcus intermedius]|uniref:Transcriptional regulatory protein n=1 Tax=Vagococcus intermedius TaxID=2991418 RepID=A0AAF0CUU5_9ENTE|nr:response regulator [Vagococcus intermedius]WEG73328.1 response regulator [Vagococcus intermedius]WEG75408.1 response regulator [Vagococcus intermedius]
MTSVNVLIVEDDPMVLYINQTYLDKIDNFTFTGSADSATSALTFLEASSVDLVLIDVHLNKSSGFDLVRAIREKNLEVDIIMITAANQSNQVEQMFRYGVIDYILKPFNFERFKASLLKFSERKMLIDSTSQLSQHELDYLSQTKESLPSFSMTEEEELEKGLTYPTLNLVKKAILSLPSQFTVNDLSNILNLSHVSIRKYIRYLEDNNYITSHLEYGTIGRPITYYSLLK